MRTGLFGWNLIVSHTEKGVKREILSAPYTIPPHSPLDSFPLQARICATLCLRLMHRLCCAVPLV